MNVNMFHAVSNKGSTIYAGNLPAFQRPALKSTQEKMERQQKAAGQIDFLENQKENLKNMECSTVEDIAKKLEKFHSYEDEIAAVKMQYNQEQMWHVMDEAEEIGEKIAEEAEKSEPKTAEERRKEMAEEALETDENKGELTESMEEMAEEVSELAEKMQEETAELTEEMTEAAEESLDELTEESMEALAAAGEEIPDAYADQKRLEDPVAGYKRIDIRV